MPWLRDGVHSAFQDENLTGQKLLCFFSKKRQILFKAAQQDDFNAFDAIICELNAIRKVLLRDLLSHQPATETLIENSLRQKLGGFKGREDGIKSIHEEEEERRQGAVLVLSFVLHQIGFMKDEHCRGKSLMELCCFLVRTKFVTHLFELILWEKIIYGIGAQKLCTESSALYHQQDLLYEAFIGLLKLENQAKLSYKMCHGIIDVLVGHGCSFTYRAEIRKTRLCDIIMSKHRSIEAGKRDANQKSSLLGYLSFRVKVEYVYVTLTKALWTNDQRTLLNLCLTFDEMLECKKLQFFHSIEKSSSHFLYETQHHRDVNDFETYLQKKQLLKNTIAEKGNQVKELIKLVQEKTGLLEPENETLCMMIEEWLTYGVMKEELERDLTVRTRNLETERYTCKQLVNSVHDHALEVWFAILLSQFQMLL